MTRNALQSRMQPGLKRKIGYENEDEEVATIRKGVCNLQMETRNESQLN
jgi:hypothetical protein